MIIKSKLLKRGFSINLFKDARLCYPNNTWLILNKEIKRIIMDNVVYLKVSPYSMILDKEFYFNFSLPYLKELGDKGIIKDIPRIAEEDKISTKKLIDKFNNKKIYFTDNNNEVISSINTNEKALIGLSFGKDSLLSYGIAKELNLKPKLVMVQDFWDIEAAHKLSLIKSFKKEFNENVDVVYDLLDEISANRRINRINSIGIVNANAMNSYMAMLLPLAIKYNTKYIVFGNEQNFNDYFINKEEFRVYPSYDQSSEWMQEQNKALKEFTKNSIMVTSFIEPIYNIAEVKVLFNRYPKIARYQMSCSLSNSRSKKERWCYKCPMCAKAFIYLIAVGRNPKDILFNKNLLDKKYKNLYPLFNSKPERLLEKPKAVRDEQLFAFYLAYRNRNKGYLIDKFKKEFLKEAKEKEDTLYKKFFGIHKSYSIPSDIKKEIISIYKEELKNG